MRHALPLSLVAFALCLAAGCQQNESGAWQWPWDKENAADTTASRTDTTYRDPTYRTDSTVPRDTRGNNASDTARPARESVGPTDRGTGTGTVSGDINAQAQQLIDQAQQQIRDNKLDLADQTLRQLETLRPQLPPSAQSRIDNVRSMLDTARRTGIGTGGTGGAGMSR